MITLYDIQSIMLKLQRLESIQTDIRIGLTIAVLALGFICLAVVLIAQEMGIF